MSFNREKNEYFFPSKVYRCTCLGEVIDICYHNGLHSFTEIYDEVTEFAYANDHKVFSVKCGESKKDTIFTCENHLAIILLAKKKYTCPDKPTFTNTTVNYTSSNRKAETYCTGCIRHYLRLTYGYFYHKNFDLKF